MKYARLTKEQQEELKPEFVRFLATQSITGDEWEEIKTKTPQVAEDEIDVFSDLIWEGVLSNLSYLENTYKNQSFLFKVVDNHIHLIHLKVTGHEINLETSEGFKWTLENIKEDTVNLSSGKKDLGDKKLEELFTLIKQGAQITDGNYFEQISSLL